MNAPLPLIARKDEASFGMDVDIAIDPHMAIHGHSSLLLRHVRDVDAALQCLGHRILLHPHDLRSHAQRILLLIRAQDGASLFGALVDLFIALEDKGLALKNRMFEFSRPLLSRTSQAFIERHLQTGIRACDPAIARLRSSLLRVGLCDTDKLILRHTSSGATHPVDRSPLEEARELLEYGQLDQAMETLENALLTNPDQQEISQELLEIYTRMGELDRLEAMREQLLINFGRVPANWPSAQT